MIYTNAQMEQMLNAASKHLDKRDVIGYAAARNTRILTTELTEFTNAKNDLICEYGKPEKDKDGNETGSFVISPSMPKFAEFAEKLKPLIEIEHDPQIFKVDAEKAIGVLSGAEMLELEWMLEGI